MSSSEDNGLSILEDLDRLVIRDSSDYPNSKYVVTDSDGKVLLYAKEECGIVNKVLGGKTRAFEIDVLDTNHKEVIKLRRPYSVGEDKLEVLVRNELVALVRKEVTFFKPVLSINDTSDRQVLRVKGPVSTTQMCDFELYSNDKQRIGAICKRWKGVTRSPGDRDVFVLHLPHLELRYKAAIIATCFFIDFLYFEN